MEYFKSLKDFADWLTQLPQAPTLLEQKLALLAKAKTTLLQHGLMPNVPVITITGTNGKGSTAYALSSFLKATGHHVGCFTSPHLFSYCERISIDLEPVSEQAFLAAANGLCQQIDLSSYNFFYCLFLLALFIFKDQPLDYIVLEVGIGGLVDATNAIDADIVILTQVALDHTQLLGDTREAIGFEKSGLLRPKQIFICGDDDPPQTVLDKAEELNCQSFWFGKQFGVFHTQNSWDLWLPNKMLCHLPPAKMQPESIACALMAMSALQDRFASKAVNFQTIQEVICNKQLIGRCQIVQYNTHEIIFDVAHNPTAVEHLAVFLKSLSDKENNVAIFGTMADKDIASMLKIMTPTIKTWFFTDLPLERAESAENIAKLYQMHTNEKTNFYCASSPQQALQVLQQQITQDTRIIVFGSFVTVTHVQQALALL